MHYDEAFTISLRNVRCETYTAQFVTTSRDYATMGANEAHVSGAMLFGTLWGEVGKCRLLPNDFIAWMYVGGKVQNGHKSRVTGVPFGV